MNTKTTAIAAILAGAGNLTALSGQGEYTAESIGGLDGFSNTEAIGNNDAATLALNSSNKVYPLDAHFTRESFDVVDASMSVAYTAAYAAFGLPEKKTGLGLAFPSLVVAPKVGFVEISAETLNIIAPNLARRISHGPASGLKEFDRVNIKEILRDPTLLLGDNETAIRLPYLAQDPFVRDVSLPVTVFGKTVNEAYIMPEVQASLVVLSASATTLANGGINETDSLTTNISLGDILISLPNTAAEPVMFNISTKHIKEAKYTPHNGLNTSFSLNMLVEEYVLTYADLISVNGKTKGGVFGTDFDKDNLSIIVNINVNGSADIEGGTVSTSGYLTLVNVVDANGNTADAAQIEFARTLISAANYAGARYIAYSSNANLRRLGKQIDVTGINPKYALDQLSPVSVKIARGDTAEVKAERLNQLIALGQYMTYAKCAVELSEHADVLDRLKTDGRLSKTKLEGVGSEKYNNYYLGKAVTVDSILNSISSGSKEDDIKAALTMMVKMNVAVMGTQSQYTMGKSSVKWLLITSELIASILPATIDAGAGTTITVTSENFITFDDTMYIVPLSTTGGNDKIDTENFGTLAVEPVTVFDGPRDMDGIVFDGVVVQPIVKAIIHLNIMTKLTVEGLEEAYIKTTQKHTN